MWLWYIYLHEWLIFMVNYTITLHGSKVDTMNFDQFQMGILRSVSFLEFLPTQKQNHRTWKTCFF